MIHGKQSITFSNKGKKDDAGTFCLVSLISLSNYNGEKFFLNAISEHVTDKILTRLNYHAGTTSVIAFFEETNVPVTSQEE